MGDQTQIKIEIVLDYDDWVKFGRNTERHHLLATDDFTPATQRSMDRIKDMIKIDNIRQDKVDAREARLREELPEATIPGCTCITNQGKCRIHNANR